MWRSTRALVHLRSTLSHIKDTQHILLECSLLALERDKMSEEVRNVVLQTKNCSINRLSIGLLLGDDDSIPSTIKVVVRKAMLKFLTATVPKVHLNP